nr:MAG TPA: hypothetical protein [Caudoviricetes sp.]
MKKIKLLESFVLKVMGKRLEELPPISLSGAQALHALWSLNEEFRPNIEQIRSMKYDERFEADADRAIERRLFGETDAWRSLSAETWRVLLERHQQAIAVAMANEMAGNPLMPIPFGLPESAYTNVVMLFLMHEMALPYPIDDWSSFELPVGSVPANLLRH